MFVFFTKGPSGGLFLALQFEPSEWSPGPYFYGQGFRVALHGPGTTMRKVYEKGISLKPDIQTEIGFTRRDGTYLVNKYDYNDGLSKIHFF